MLAKMQTNTLLILSVPTMWSTKLKFSSSRVNITSCQHIHTLKL